MLVQNLDRLDENVKEDSDGVHNTLGLSYICYRFKYPNKKLIFLLPRFAANSSQSWKNWPLNNFNFWPFTYQTCLIITKQYLSTKSFIWCHLNCLSFFFVLLCFLKLHFWIYFLFGSSRNPASKVYSHELKKVLFFHLKGIIENMTELRTSVCQAAGEQGMLGWLLRRLKVCVVVWFVF